MKLTRSPNSERAVFYRDNQKGGLYLNNDFKNDKAEYIIENLPFKKSLLTRILLKSNKGNEKTLPKVTKFVDRLIKENLVEGMRAMEQISKYNKTSVLKCFSAYGSTIRIGKNGISLPELLNKYYDSKGAISQELKTELETFHALLQNRLQYKKDKLKKSIAKNIISPFKVEWQSKKRNKFLLSILINKCPPSTEPAKANKKTDYDFIYESTYESLYNFSELTKKLKEIVDSLLEKETIKGNKRNDKLIDRTAMRLGREVYKTVKEYNKTLYNNHKNDTNFIFFLNEVQAYFRHYFGSNNTKRYLTSKKKIYFLIGSTSQNNSSGKASSYPQRYVKGHVINKINAMLIQNGKLFYYDKKSPTSTDLSNIQIEESFKKQLFVSLAWAITRLNYFFNYGSNNETMIGKDKDDSGIGGDILFDFDENNSLKDAYEKNTMGAYKKTYLDTFLQNLHNVTEQKEFREKVCTTFPISMASTNNDTLTKKLLSLLDATKDCISFLRNNLFHPKKDFLYELSQDPQITSKFAKEYFSELKNVFKTDINSVNDCFKEKIRSMMINTVYPFEILQKIFFFDKLHFNVYTPEDLYAPSFRNIYKRGANLYKSTEGTNVNWYCELKEKDTNSIKKAQAYRNILYLIYKYAFLPAVSVNNHLVTDSIEKTKKLSKENSHSTKNNSRNQNFCFRYNDMPPYTGQNLMDYMAELQRLQSQVESNKHDDKTDLKNNYYVDFIKDIYVYAFNDYLDALYNPPNGETIKGKLQAVFKNDYVLPDERTAEDTLNNLFYDDGQPRLIMHCTINKTDKDDALQKRKYNLLLLFYPFLRTLEKRELSNIQQQIIRYRASLKTRSNANEYTQEDTYSKYLEELIALLIFTFPDHINEEQIYKDMLEKHFKKFIENDISQYTDLYYQQDKKSPIMHRSMLALMRTGVLPLYADIFAANVKGIKILPDDYHKYREYRAYYVKNNNNNELIEQLQETAAKLHEELCKSSYKTESDFLNKIENYKTTVKEINNYTNLRRRLTFDMLYEVYVIHVNILSRFVSFVADWERDMHFLLLGLFNLGQTKEFQLLSSKKFPGINGINKIFEYNPKDKSSVVSKFKIYLGNNEQILNFLLMTNCYANLQDIIFVRNSIAHLNHITQCKVKKKSSPQRSIIELINSRVSALLNYDLKRKNSITRVLKEVLQKNHVNINFTLKDNIYSLQHPTSENIFHLKNIKYKKDHSFISAEFPIPAKDEVFLKCIEKLLNFSYNDE